MKKKTSHGKWVTLALVVAASGLLIGSAVGGTRAALTYFSENYTADFQVTEIDVALVENGTESPAQLLSALADEKIVPGTEYSESLAAKNTGDIDEYVRVRITKCWMQDGEKELTLSPDNIILGLDEENWMVDSAASTKERTVIYAREPLAVGESRTFCETISIDQAVLNKATQTVTEENGYTTITTEYKYNGVTFHVEAQVDAVQTHNAQDAIKSAWGVNVDVAADGTLSLR